jgi:hypothetical protein
MGRLIRIPPELLTKEQQEAQDKTFDSQYRLSIILSCIGCFVIIVFIALVIWIKLGKREPSPAKSPLLQSATR